MSNQPAPAVTHGAPIVRRSLASRILRNPLGLVSSAIIALVAIAAIAAPLIAPLDPAATDAMNIMAGPSGSHLLGTDSAGRDILSRIIFGSQATLLSALIVVVTSIIIGVPTGLIAGYYGGRFDSIASWIANMLMSLPSIIVLLAVRAAVGPSIAISMFVFGILIALNIETIIPFIEHLFNVQFLAKDVYYISDLPSDLVWSDVITIVCVSFLLSLLATIYPSYKASRINPAEALRYE